jgi:hypothetical protein
MSESDRLQREWEALIGDMDAPLAPETRQRLVLIHNERTKLLASAVDRVSTAFVAAGVAAPIAAGLFNATSRLSLGYYIAAAYVFLFIAVCLHAVSRRLLGGLR